MASCELRYITQSCETSLHYVPLQTLMVLSDQNKFRLMCTQNLVGFCQFVLNILSGNEILTSIKGCNSVKILRKMTANNPKLDLVNVDVHTKFGRILSIRSQDIERKQDYTWLTRGECILTRP